MRQKNLHVDILISQELFNKLLIINYLVHIKATGTPKVLAGKLNVGERTIYKYMRLIKQLGAPVKYSAQSCSYFYEDEGNHLTYLNRVHSVLSES